MLEEAVARVRPVFGSEVFVSTTKPLQATIEASGVVEAGQVLAEPARRNTLGALVWSVAHLLAAADASTNEGITVAVLTADHKIDPTDRFLSALGAAMTLAESSGDLVTLGIEPTRPETGFGYIEVDRAEPVQTADARPAYRSKRFREKPSSETAADYLAGGNHLWNSGMLVFTIDGFLRALQAADPEAHAGLLAITEAVRAQDRATAVRHFESLPNLSIDFALLERAPAVSVILADFGWDDLGTWEALERASRPDEQGNVLRGTVVALETENSLVVNETEGLVVGVLGLTDLIVVATAEAVLVCPKSRAQSVNQIVARLGSAAARINPGDQG
jgi:mannose-1-phosphate guanylyltransferase